MRRALVVALVAAWLIPAAPSIARMGEPERAIVTMTNAARDRHGLSPLSPGWRLRRYAERHARAMARQGRIFHGHLGFGEGRRCWGQNVGVGETPWRVFRAFMRSASHRSNILNECFRYIGVGVVRSGGLVWVVMDFGSAPTSRSS